MARLPVPRPTGLEPPRVKAPGPSRTGAGLGSASPAWRAPGLALLRLASPLLEAAARSRVNSPVARDLARSPAFDAGGGWGRGTVRPCTGAGGVSAREWRGDDSLCCLSKDPLGPPLGLPSAGRQRRSEANPRGSCQDGTPSPRSRRCHRHRRHCRPHRGTLPQAPPSVWTSLGVSPTLGARDSFSSPSSFLSPLRTSAFPRTLAACHDRPRLPLLGAWKIERRSILVRAKVSLKRRSKGIDDQNRKQEKELTRSIDP
jgi:hypothetical protein